MDFQKKREKEFGFISWQITPEGIYYGIITEQFVWTDEEERWEAQDTAQVKGFSESLEESMAFFEKMVQGEVMPVSLNEIVDDWKSAFYMGRKESA